ncbi:AI-2E family transporter [Brumimicrobium salinarum]|uniref:AI-2E family transporter n=1 Tax=Brumimicrobium salinarum TaxID=2058658 RepID=A0A2I0R475_9FLAO|nr:AI-2E family transporter [Brumimicrobium salinarum]PKR81190.1 AI-2E family transporter [Brumimicrobium salinarum]
MKNTAYFFITTIAIVIILIYGKSILIPFVFALLLWFIVRKIRQEFNKVKFINKYFPLWLKNLIPSVLLLIVLSFITKLMMMNIAVLTQSYSLYEGNIAVLIEQVNELFKINLIDFFKANAGTFDFGSILQKIIESLTSLVSNAFIILIYVLFILLEETNFYTKMKIAFAENEQILMLTKVLEEIEVSVSKYIGLKTLISFITGFASYIALYFIGIDAPLFWAFLIFLLNFIPTIGSLIATLFPMFFCLLQFGDFSKGLIVLGVVGGIQVLVGNVLEPKLAGNTLNISPLLAIFALTFWGALWGVTGMLVSVPITVIMVIVFSHFNMTKPIAIMFSEKGEI